MKFYIAAVVFTWAVIGYIYALIWEHGTLPSWFVIVFEVYIFIASLFTYDCVRSYRGYKASRDRAAPPDYL